MMAQPDGRRDDVTAFEALTRALIGIALESIRVAGGEVTLPQFRLMLALSDLGRVPSSRLAEQLGLAASAITRMTDRLERVDLVERGDDPRSRSIVTVALTATGRRLVAAVLADRQARMAAILDEMDHDRRVIAVEAVNEFVSRSGDAVALGAAGPVPV